MDTHQPRGGDRVSFSADGAAAGPAHSVVRNSSPAAANYSSSSSSRSISPSSTSAPTTLGWKPQPLPAQMPPLMFLPTEEALEREAVRARTS